MICVPIPCRRFAGAVGLMVAGLGFTSCAGRTEGAARGSHAYVVYFSATRLADHTALSSVSVPVTLGNEARATTSIQPPAENHPTLPEFRVRLQRTRQPGVYELVTRVTVREAIRNKKGKLKGNKRYLGALVPTHLGETQVVSAETDPIHLEARLERR